MKQGAWQLGKQEAKIQLKISGTIDGNFFFPDASKIDSTAQVEVDLSDFQTMNSEGIRNWIQWQRSLDRSIQFSYFNAPSVFIVLASMISGLVSDCRCIQSFYVQYAEEGGKRRAQHLIEQTKEGHFFIPKSYQGMELDHLVAKDFRILGRNYTLV